MFVVTSQFHVLQTGTIAEGIVGEVEDVVRFVVRAFGKNEV
jgi:hypothetical protein